MKKYILSTFILLAALLQVNTAAAQYNGQAYTVTNIKDLGSMVTNDTMMLFDGVLPTVPQSDTNWQDPYCFGKVRGTVALRIKKDLSVQAIPESFTCTVVVAVRYWETGRMTGTMPGATNIMLKVSYDKRKGMVYDEASLKTFNNAHYIDLKLVSVSNAAVKNFLQLHINMDGERNYCKGNFTAGVPCVQKTEYLPGTNEWEVTFYEQPLLNQADEFDLEWAFVDYYDEKAYNTGTKTGTYSFQNNATRVILGKNQRTFRIKNIFERGFVVFRYRMVAYYNETTFSGENVTLRLTGSWSDDDYANDEFSGDPDELENTCSDIQSALAIINEGVLGVAAPHL
ncbi:MAG: hypothetical protein V4658_06950, partial [Bacteroidota bacterium]